MARALCGAEPRNLPYHEAVRTVPRRRLLAALLLAVAAPMASAALAQVGQDPNWRPRIWVGGGRFYRTPPKWAARDNFDGSWNFCRGFYYSNRREAGGSGWDTDFPGADNNFSVRLGELTNVAVRLDASGQPDYVVVRLTDPLLSRCTMLHLEDAGTARFTDEEVEALRAYLLKGGFMTVDDFWGTDAWDQWADEIGRVLPPSAYPIFDIPLDHPIMHTLYDVKEIEQVSSIQFWGRWGSVSERGADSARVNFRGINDEKGRLMVVMAHNTDIPDTWEREGENKEYFDRFSPNGYAVGVNIVLYALTH
ncbi:MAG: transmembrane prediction [Acidobacteria bacterium]|nr:MAG: transmembrane prediction [Acidobacteriota bacterium]